jgi:hypothetical protein
MSGEEARALLTEGVMRKQVIATPTEVKWLDPGYPFDTSKPDRHVAEHNTIITVNGQYQMSPSRGRREADGEVRPAVLSRDH